MKWIKSPGTLPKYGELVLAFLQGEETWEGFFWNKSGYALMVRYDSAGYTVRDGWDKRHYEEALKALGADWLKVTHWMSLPHPPEPLDPQGKDGTTKRLVSLLIGLECRDIPDLLLKDPEVFFRLGRRIARHAGRKS